MKSTHISWGPPSWLALGMHHNQRGPLELCTSQLQPGRPPGSSEWNWFPRPPRLLSNKHCSWDFMRLWLHISSHWALPFGFKKPRNLIHFGKCWNQETWRISCTSVRALPRWGSWDLWGEAWRVRRCWKRIPLSSIVKPKPNIIPGLPTRST